jgi:hypothetical protein
MSGKELSCAGIFINSLVKSDLSWLVGTIPKSIGVHIIGIGAWDDSAADMVLWMDSSLWIVMSFVYAGNGFAYQVRPCAADTKIDIFFLELVAILSAIHHVASFDCPPQRVLLFMDSLDSVASLNSLHVSESLHNGPLLGIAEVILRTGLDLHVRHIKGKRNIWASMLSCSLMDEYARHFPSDHVHTFEPPRELLPA